MTANFRNAPLELDRIETLPAPPRYGLVRLYWKGRVYDLFWDENAGQDLYHSHHVSTGAPISGAIADAMRSMLQARHQELLRVKFLEDMEHFGIKYVPFGKPELGSDSEQAQTTIGHTDGS